MERPFLALEQRFFTNIIRDIIDTADLFMVIYSDIWIPHNDNDMLDDWAWWVVGGCG